MKSRVIYISISFILPLVLGVIFYKTLPVLAQSTSVQPFEKDSMELALCRGATNEVDQAISSSTLSVSPTLVTLNLTSNSTAVVTLTATNLTNVPLTITIDERYPTTSTDDIIDVPWISVMNPTTSTIPFQQGGPPIITTTIDGDGSIVIVVTIDANLAEDEDFCWLCFLQKNGLDSEAVRFELNIIEDKPIPTLSEWGVIVMGLLLLTVGTLFILAYTPTKYNNGLMAFQPITLFHFPIFIRMWVLTILLTWVGFAIAITSFDYILMPADPGGSLVSATILAYMLQMWWVNRQ